MNLTILSESQWNIDSNDILSVICTEILSSFTHESNTFLGEQYAIPPIQMNGVQMPKNPRNSPFPLRHVDPSNTSMPGPTALTMPNDSSIGSCTSVHLCNKGPIGYSGTPLIHPLPFDDHHPICYYSWWIYALSDHLLVLFMKTMWSLLHTEQVSHLSAI